MAKVEEHNDEQEHDHDRARVHEHLDHTDEVRVHHHVQRGQVEHHRDEPQRRRDGTLPGDKRKRRRDREQPEEVEVNLVEQREVRGHRYSPRGSAGSHISQTWCVCDVNRSRSYTNPSRLYSEFS